jgi:hypothetical protein
MSKLQKKPSALKRDHPILQNMNFYKFFSTFVGHFCPPGSGSGSASLIITQFISAQQEVIKFAAETKEGLNFHKQMTEAMVYPGQSKKEWGFQTVGGIASFGGFQERQLSLSGQLLLFFQLNMLYFP